MESGEVPPALLEAEQPQLPPLCLVTFSRPFQSLVAPSLDALQHINIPFKLKGPETDHSTGGAALPLQSTETVPALVLQAALLLARMYRRSLPLGTAIAPMGCQPAPAPNPSPQVTPPQARSTAWGCGNPSAGSSIWAPAVSREQWREVSRALPRHRPGRCWRHSQAWGHRDESHRVPSPRVKVCTSGWSHGVFLCPVCCVNIGL